MWFFGIVMLEAAAVIAVVWLLVISRENEEKEKYRVQVEVSPAPRMTAEEICAIVESV